jgi:myo-inositol-1-phosphate synthase
VVINTIRLYDECALDHGIGEVLYSPLAYFMKHTAIQYPNGEAYSRTEEFIVGNRKR